MLDQYKYSDKGHDTVILDNRGTSSGEKSMILHQERILKILRIALLWVPDGVSVYWIPTGYLEVTSNLVYPKPHCLAPPT